MSEYFDVFLLKGGSIEISNTIEEDVHIDPSNLFVEMLDHANKFHKWACAYEAAVRDEMEAKQEVERVAAHVAFHARQDMTNGGIRATDAKVKDTVTTHSLYKEALNEYNEAKFKAGLLRRAMDAMIHRRDMLIQMGYAARADSNADITIKKRADAVRDIINNR